MKNRIVPAAALAAFLTLTVAAPAVHAATDTAECASPAIAVEGIKIFPVPSILGTPTASLPAGSELCLASPEQLPGTNGWKVYALAAGAGYVAAPAVQPVPAGVTPETLTDLATVLDPGVAAGWIGKLGQGTSNVHAAPNAKSPMLGKLSPGTLVQTAVGVSATGLGGVQGTTFSPVPFNGGVGWLQEVLLAPLPAADAPLTERTLSQAAELFESPLDAAPLRTLEAGTTVRASDASGGWMRTTDGWLRLVEASSEPGGGDTDDGDRLAEAPLFREVELNGEPGTFWDVYAKPNPRGTVIAQVEPGLVIRIGAEQSWMLFDGYVPFEVVDGVEHAFGLSIGDRGYLKDQAIDGSWVDWVKEKAGDVRDSLPERGTGEAGIWVRLRQAPSSLIAATFTIIGAVLAVLGLARAKRGVPRTLLGWVRLGAVPLSVSFLVVGAAVTPWTAPAWLPVVTVAGAVTSAVAVARLLARWRGATFITDLSRVELSVRNVARVGVRVLVPVIALAMLGVIAWQAYVVAVVIGAGFAAGVVLTERVPEPRPATPDSTNMSTEALPPATSLWANEDEEVQRGTDF